MEAGFKNPRAGPAGSQLWVLPQGHPRQKGNGPRAGKGAPPDIVPDTGLRPPGSPGGSNGGAETSTKDTRQLATRGRSPSRASPLCVCTGSTASASLGAGRGACARGPLVRPPTNRFA